MRILITGICGFVGSTIARTWLDHFEGVRISGIDWLGRRGSESNLADDSIHTLCLAKVSVRLRSCSEETARGCRWIA